MKNAQLGSRNKMRGGDLLGCLLASTECIKDGRILHSLGRQCTKVIPESVVWFLKLWKIMIVDLVCFLCVSWRDDINLL
jgi:hypothetical protein